MTDDVDVADEESANQPEPVATDTRSLRLRYSVLKMIKQSPAHARSAMLRDWDKQTLSMRLGSGCHALTFGTPEVVAYPGRRAGKDWVKFEAENADKVIVNTSEHRKAVAMAAAIKANPVAARVLLAPDAVREEQIEWEWSGRAWRSTPDMRSFRTLAELKTTRCADPAVFWRDALKMSYHVQLAIYCRAIEQTTGVRPRDVYLFAVESVPPYVVTPFRLSERSLEHGDRLACEWHERFLQCEREDSWPAYTTGIEELDIYEIEDELDAEVARAMADDDGTRASVNF